MLLSYSTFLFILLGSTVPALIYSLIIWASMPLNYVNLKKGLSYIVPGIASVFIVNVIHVMFPSFFVEADTGAHSVNMFYLTFFQVGMIEEYAKWLALYLTIRNKNAFSDNPLSIMYYGGAVAAGFAMIENVYYGVDYSSYTLALVRGTSSTIAHMTCGLIMGYWVAKAYRIEKRDRSYFSLIFKAFPRLKIATLTFMGIATATFMHGLYDFNLFMESPSMHPIVYIVLALGVIISYIAAKDLAKNICDKCVTH